MWLLLLLLHRQPRWLPLQHPSKLRCLPILLL
jgi:hypothetical protein